MNPRRVLVLLQMLFAVSAPTVVVAEVLPPVGVTDARVRTVPYQSDQVYRLRGFVGYSVHLIFAPGEVFTGLGGGDVEGISWDAEGNHLFIKPRQPDIQTNFTLLTSQRAYEFHYSTERWSQSTPDSDIIYAIRFTYPEGRQAPAQDASRSHSLIPDRVNDDYWYCGEEALKPDAMWDDGTRTAITFAPRAQWPAVFAIEDDGTESLVNYSVVDSVLIIHRTAIRFLLRRGRSVGCLMSGSYNGNRH